MRLQNVFAPSQAKEQGITLALALSQRLLQGQGACRVHGGGFAGTIQAYVPFSLLESYRQGMESVFGAGSCYVLSFRQAGGPKSFCKKIYQGRPDESPGHLFFLQFSPVCGILSRIL